MKETCAGNALQDTGDQHNQRDVQRKAGAAARLVDRVDLVGITGDWAGRDEYRCDVLDYGIETEHGVRGGDEGILRTSDVF